MKQPFELKNLLLSSESPRKPEIDCLASYKREKPTSEVKQIRQQLPKNPKEQNNQADSLSKEKTSTESLESFQKTTTSKPNTHPETQILAEKTNYPPISLRNLIAHQSPERKKMSCQVKPSSGKSYMETSEEESEEAPPNPHDKSGSFYVFDEASPGRERSLLEDNFELKFVENSKQASDEEPFHPNLSSETEKLIAEHHRLSSRFEDKPQFVNPLIASKSLHSKGSSSLETGKFGKKSQPPIKQKCPRNKGSTTRVNTDHSEQTRPSSRTKPQPERSHNGRYPTKSSHSRPGRRSVGFLRVQFVHSTLFQPKRITSDPLNQLDHIKAIALCFELSEQEVIALFKENNGDIKKMKQRLISKINSK